MTRRDKCFLAGRRAEKLSDAEAVLAWRFLAARLERLGDKDVPKFADLFHGVRAATIAAKSFDTTPPW